MKNILNGILIKLLIDGEIVILKRTKRGEVISKEIAKTIPKAENNSKFGRWSD